MKLFRAGDWETMIWGGGGVSGVEKRSRHWNGWSGMVHLVYSGEVKAHLGFRCQGLELGLVMELLNPLVRLFQSQPMLK